MLKNGIKTKQGKVLVMKRYKGMLLSGNVFYHLIPKTATRCLRQVFKDMGKIKNDHCLSPLKPSYSFCVCRNPWDRLVSAWKDKVVNQWSNNYPEHLHVYRINSYQKFKDKDFSFFVKHINVNMENHVRPQLDFIDTSSISFICRFENLQYDLDTLFKNLDYPEFKLPHEGKWKSKHKHYTKYYDDETREIVAEKYAKDIEYFGYEFGQ